MRAAAHPRQTERLQALYAYDILDTPREREFDDIVALAAKICEAPISVVNLIDADRQWFKAEVGLGVRETPLETSLCSHVILDKSFVEIPDTLEDRRMQDNPLCLGEPGLRFYAGARLETDEGLPLGTLCILDNEPRALDDLQKEALRVLAAQVMKQLDLRLALKQEAKTRQLLEARTEELVQALDQQKVLAKEIDHRAKNSLQIVSSLLGLERTKAKAPETVAVLEAAERRVAAIALFHEELYQASTTDRVDMHRFLSNIAESLRRTSGDEITINFDLKPGDLSSEKAYALAVIVNEFVANAIKHAFPNGDGGEIRALGRWIDKQNYRLVLSDDGVGLSGETVPSRDGLGMKIMKTCASRLETQLDWKSSDIGTQLVVDFAPM